MTPARSAADALGVGQRLLPGLAGGVLVDGQQGRHAPALGVDAADQVPGALRSDHGHVHDRRRHDLVEVDVEPVGEHEHVALFEVVADGGLVDDLLGLVGDHHHDDVGRRGSRVGRHDLEAGRDGAVPGGGARSLGHDHFDAAVPQVLGMSVSLAAEADDGHGLAVEEAQICILFVQHGSLNLLCLFSHRAG